MEKKCSGPKRNDNITTDLSYVECVMS